MGVFLCLLAALPAWGGIDRKKIGRKVSLPAISVPAPTEIPEAVPDTPPGEPEIEIPIIPERPKATPPPAVEAPATPTPRLGPEPTPFAINLQLSPEAPWQWPVPTRGDDVMGDGPYFYQVKQGETLLELARGLGLGYNEIMDANPGINPWLPPAGTQVRFTRQRIIPMPDKPWKILINLPEMRLYQRLERGLVGSHPVGVGREGFETPVGWTKLVRKKSAPSWYVPQSVRKEDPRLPPVVGPGPDNPLGTHALYLDWPSYLIHGTNQPFGIGRRVSHGCIRLYPEDIPRLFKRANVGDRVVFVHRPAKAGWLNGELYLELHRPITQELASRSQKSLQSWTHEAINAALARRPRTPVMLNWPMVEQMIAQPDGVPYKVGRRLTPEEKLQFQRAGQQKNPIPKSTTSQKPLVSPPTKPGTQPATSQKPLVSPPAAPIPQPSTTQPATITQPIAQQPSAIHKKPEDPLSIEERNLRVLQQWREKKDRARRENSVVPAGN
ncbi:MAG: L,D-transpeptidase family protein [Magnetococcales bacterium]|nr:L,D-transpeptidase family protein [Magnetococcales bacterium]